MGNDKLKQCPKCTVWFGIDDICSNPDIKPLGMTFEKGNINRNLFFFNHTSNDCGTTFTLKVDVLAELIKNPTSSEILAGGDTCEGHCSDINDTTECSQTCKYAPYRRLLRELIDNRIKLKETKVPLE
ncbi:MAG: hypothetical protein GY841_13425 [FCB group bacterium]|nr:hypothetical protein [FCB group bacterium]